MPSSLDCTVYIGDLGSLVTKQDLEDAFSQYGRLNFVLVPRPHYSGFGFGFVEFHNNRDAKDAVKSLDGSNICGRRVRVEFSTGRSRGGSGGSGGGRYAWGGGGGFRRGGAHTEDKCYQCSERGHFARDCGSSRSGGSGGFGARRRDRVAG